MREKVRPIQRLKDVYGKDFITTLYQQIDKDFFEHFEYENEHIQEDRHIKACAVAALVLICMKLDLT